MFWDSVWFSYGYSILNDSSQISGDYNYWIFNDLNQKKLLIYEGQSYVIIVKFAAIEGVFHCFIVVYKQIVLFL